MRTGIVGCLIRAPAIRGIRVTFTLARLAKPWRKFTSIRRWVYPERTNFDVARDRVHSKIGGLSNARSATPRLDALEAEIHALRAERRVDMDALRAELRAEVDVIGGTLKHLTNVIVPLRAPAALAVGLATLSIANLIAMTCRHERGMDILKGLQMIPNDLPQGSFTVASNVDALRLASLLLSPQQPEWDSYQQFTQLLRQALSASDPAAELERVVDSLPAVPAQIQTRGRHRINYGDEMHVEAFLAVVEMHLEAEAEANRPLSHSWQEMLWLWEQLVGIPAVESRARLSLEDQRIILYS